MVKESFGKVKFYSPYTNIVKILKCHVLVVYRSLQKNYNLS